MNGKVTQRDVAKKAGVSHVTVSLALRGHPGIPAETRERIRAIADGLGYVPDPMLSALSSYRKRKRPQAFQANIAWINNFRHSDELYAYDFGEYYEGAVERSRELGFQLEEYRIAEAGQDWKGLKRILLSRGVQGILLAPSEKPNARFELDLTAFSAVRFGYSYSHPILNTVANMQFTTVVSAVENLAALGYKRIGLVITEEVHARTGLRFLGGFAAAQSQFPKKDRISPLALPENSDVPKVIAAWVARQKIDCILSIHGMGRYRQLLAAGLQIPERIGYADLGLAADEPLLSGICQNSKVVGAKAVDLVVSMIHMQERGVPANCAHILVDGYWIAGKTTRRQGSV